MLSNKRKVVGKLVSVSPTAGKLVVREDSGREHDVRFLDPRYWATGAEYRAYESLLKLRKFVGKEVEVQIEHHTAFGDTVFGRRLIKRVGGSRRR